MGQTSRVFHLTSAGKHSVNQTLCKLSFRTGEVLHPNLLDEILQKSKHFYNYYLCAVCFGVFSASCIHLKSYNLAWAESQIYKIDALMSQMCVQLHLYRHRYHPIFIYGKSLWGEIATTTGKDEAFCG